MAYNVFISWSGTRSQRMAASLVEFLPDVLQAAQPWFSTEHIESGQLWRLKLADALKELRIGILCLTAENLTSPWLLFEAGALSKTVENAFVCPYILGLEKRDVPTPLGDFQIRRADKSDTLALIRTINAALGSPVSDPSRLNRTFERAWPDFENVLKSIEAEGPPKSATVEPRTAEELLGEVLDRLRGVQVPPRADDVAMPAKKMRAVIEAIVALKGPNREFLRMVQRGHDPTIAAAVSFGESSAEAARDRLANLFAKVGIASVTELRAMPLIGS